MVGYVSELPRPGTYCTKTVMDGSILLTRASDGVVRAFENVCLHRQLRIAYGCGAVRRLACPYHSWSYDLNGNLAECLVGRLSRNTARLYTAVDPVTGDRNAVSFDGFGLDRTRRWTSPTFLGPLAEELDWRASAWWSPLGEKVLDCPIDERSVIDTFAENYHFAYGAQDHVCDDRTQ